MEGFLHVYLFIYFFMTLVENSHERAVLTPFAKVHRRKLFVCFVSLCILARTPRDPERAGELTADDPIYFSRNVTQSANNLVPYYWRLFLCAFLYPATAATPTSSYLLHLS